MGRFLIAMPAMLRARKPKTMGESFPPRSSADTSDDALFGEALDVAHGIA